MRKDEVDRRDGERRRETVKWKERNGEEGKAMEKGKMSRGKWEGNRSVSTKKLLKEN